MACLYLVGHDGYELPCNAGTGRPREDVVDIGKLRMSSGQMGIQYGVHLFIHLNVAKRHVEMKIYDLP